MIITAQIPKFSKSTSDRRAALEKMRSARVKRIEQDIKKIAKREVEFSKSLVDEFIPYEISWNESAFDALKKHIPFSFEKKKPSVEIVYPEIGSESE